MIPGSQGGIIVVLGDLPSAALGWKGSIPGLPRNCQGKTIVPMGRGAAAHGTNTNGQGTPCALPEKDNVF